MVHLGRRVPQNVKFEITGRAPVRSLKFLCPQLHNVAGDCQRGMRVLWIATRPKLGPNLVSGDLTAASYCRIIVAAFEH